MQCWLRQFFRGLYGRYEALGGARATVLLVVLATACAPELEKLPRARSHRGSLGEESYKLVCRRLAGTQIPMDLDGSESATLCLGDADAVREELSARAAELPPALAAFVERRESFIRAVDESLDEELAEDFEQLLRGLIPYYAPDSELMQAGTRSTAALLERLTADPAALAALARYTREGMVPAGTANGVTRALSAHEDVSRVLRPVLGALLRGEAHEPFDALLRTFAFELATAEPDQDGDAARLRALLRRRDGARDPSRFATGRPLHPVLRDPRGLPRAAVTAGSLAYPFVDHDADGEADVEGDSFVLDPRFTGLLPEPYPTLREARGAARDAYGRACALTLAGSDCTQLLYQYEEADADLTFLSALLSELSGLFEGEPSIITSLLKALPNLLEPADMERHAYGSAVHTYAALPVQPSVPLDLLHAGLSVVEDQRYDDSLSLLQRMLVEQEPALAHALAPVLAIQQLTRRSADAYPEAELPDRNVFWDELLYEAEKLARFRASPTQESALEGLMRGALGYARATEQAGKPTARLMPLEQAKHAGALLAILMRYKDEWRANPRPKSERGKDEPATIGRFATPVDRGAPDSPVSCGRDGCGGPIAGTPFEPFQLDGQVCMVEMPGRRGVGKDCGAPANQSIFQRALGLLWESEGRSQCNRTVTIAEVVDDAWDDPCLHLEPERSCAADGDCNTQPGSGVGDYACDTNRKLCIAKAGSATCRKLQDDERGTRAAAALIAEIAVAADYVCPDDPKAPCRAYADRYPAAFIDVDGEGPKRPALQPCHAIDLKDVGRTFGQAITREYEVTLPNPWVRRFFDDVARAGPTSANDERPKVPDCGLLYRMTDPEQTPTCIPIAARLLRAALGDDIPAEVDTLGELLERLLGDEALFASEEDARLLRPDARVLARVLFSPAPDDDIPLFSPMLVRGAPPVCSEGDTRRVCSSERADSLDTQCCIDEDNPPLRYRIDTYYGATTFAWEQPVEFADGTKLSFLEAVRPISDVFNRIESALPAAQREDASYALTRLGKLMAEHYDSAANPAVQSSDPAGGGYRRKTGLVHYERLLADLLDDGSVVTAQAGPDGKPLFAGKEEPKRALDMLGSSLALLEKLDGMDFSEGRDGLSVLASGTELLLNPHAYCAGERGDDTVREQRGACDAATRERTPLRFRSGRAFPCFADDSCFDGQAPARPRRHVSAARLVLEPLRILDSRARFRPDADDALHALFNGVVDRYLQVSDNQFARPRIPALLEASVGYARDRWAEEKSSGQLTSYRERMVREAEATVHRPALSGVLLLLSALGRDEDATWALSQYGEAVFGSAQQRALLASISDMLQTPDGDQALLALVHELASAVAPNVREAVGSPDQPLDVEHGMLLQQLRILDKLSARDDQAALGRLLPRLTSPSGDGAAPLERFSDLLFAVNREEPGARTALRAVDLRSTLLTLASLMRDRKTGLERVYKVIQCATASQTEGCN